MDNTYKTNKYGLPLFAITGSTSLYTTLLVGYAFLLNETQEDFEWVLESYRQYLRVNDIPNPRVIITDKDMALANAVYAIFPETAWILCKFHIKRNICSNARKHLNKCGNIEEWAEEIQETREDNAANENADGEVAEGENEDENETRAFKKLHQHFESLWRAVTDAPTEEAYENAWNILKEEFGAPHRCLKLIKYIEDTWILFRWYFLDCHTNIHQHWGTKVTNRTEGSHWRLKSRLKSSQGDLRTVIKELMGLKNDWMTTYCQEVDYHRQNTKFRHHIPLLQHLLTKISLFALKKVYEQWQLVKDHREVRKQLRDCQQVFTRTMGLPCCHTINAKINRRGGDTGALTLRKEDIHRHWWLNPSAISRRQIQNDEGD